VVALTNNSPPTTSGAGRRTPEDRLPIRPGTANSEIYVMNADGSAPTSSPTTRPSSSTPCGPRTARRSLRVQSDGNYRYLCDNADDRSDQAHEQPCCRSICCGSPDGQKIAFASTRTGTTRLCDERDGSAQTRLTNNTSSEIAPTWSPDGQKIAFCQDPGATRTPGSTS